MNQDDAENFQIYVEETDQHTRALCETLSSWQQDPAGEAWRKESLRLLHAMEGAAGAMELESIRQLTQALNLQFDRVCLRGEQLDPAAMERLLQGVEFLRDCNERLRRGESLVGAAELLEQLKAAQQD
jgi:chemotaxis protein histidine kinase CheA